MKRVLQAIILGALLSTLAATLVNQVRAQAPATLGSGDFILCASGVSVTTPASDTNENVTATCSIPAGAMGPNGAIRVTSYWTMNNNGNNKSVRVRFSGVGGTQYHSIAYSSNVSAAEQFMIFNRGSQSSQYGTPGGGLASNTGLGSSTGVGTTSSVDTSQPTSLVFTCQKATGTDTCTMEAFIVEVFPRF